MDDFEKSFQIMKFAITNNEWEKRIDVIRKEKQKILDYFNFFPTIERTLLNDFKFKFNEKPYSIEDVSYHKYFSSTFHIPNANVVFIANKQPLSDLTKILNSLYYSSIFNSIDFIFVVNGSECTIHPSTINSSLLETNKILVFNGLDVHYLLSIYTKHNKQSKIVFIHEDDKIDKEALNGIDFDIEYSSTSFITQKSWISRAINFTNDFVL
jgi:hypothetical protein